MGKTGIYSSYKIASGVVYTAGQIGAIQGEAGPDIAAQTMQAIRNLGAVLESAGSSLRNVVKITLFLTDMANYDAMNETYAAEFAKAGTAPARTTVAVRELPRVANVPLLIELEAVATLAEPL